MMSNSCEENTSQLIRAKLCLPACLRLTHVSSCSLAILPKIKGADLLDVPACDTTIVIGSIRRLLKPAGVALSLAILAGARLDVGPVIGVEVGLDGLAVVVQLAERLAHPRQAVECRVVLADRQVAQQRLQAVLVRDLADGHAHKPRLCDRVRCDVLLLVEVMPRLVVQVRHVVPGPRAVALRRLWPGYQSPVVRVTARDVAEGRGRRGSAPRIKHDVQAWFVLGRLH